MMQSVPIPEKSSVPEKSVDQPRSWIKPYYKSFNGLRALAVLTTFYHHYAAFIRPTSFGHFTWVGVDLFFVLSGFLITGILYDSLDRPRYFRNFYIRRSLRIFPVFYGFFLLLFLLTPLLHLRYDVRILGFFFYIGNLLVPFTNLGLHKPTVIFMLYHGSRLTVANIGHLWSLCVEEQFYLIWPAVLWFVRSRRALMNICLAGSVLALLIRCYLRAHVDMGLIQALLLHWSTYTRFDTLLIGSWLALWLRGISLSKARLQRLGLLLLALPVAVLATYSLFRLHHRTSSAFTDPFLDTWGYTLVALAAAGLLLLSLDEAGYLSRFLQWRPLAFLGTISYGFYFFHAFPEILLQRLAGLHPHWRFAMPLLAFVLTTLLATLSFHFYEAPFLKLKSRFAPSHKSVPSGREELHLSDAPLSPPGPPFHPLKPL